MKIAWVSDENLKQNIDDDLPIITEIEKSKHQVSVNNWQDPEIDWSDFEVIVVRSTYNYPQNYKQFKSWLTQLHTSKLKVINPVEWMLWNINKRYLSDLANWGWPIPKFKVIKKGLNFRADNTEIVKPCVGNMSRGVRQGKGKWQKATEDLIVQERVNGFEWSYVFINSQFSHVFTREKIKWGHKPGASLDQLKSWLEKIPKEVKYVRIDTLETKEQVWVLELELIEPYLGIRKQQILARNFANILVV